MIRLLRPCTRYIIEVLIIAGLIFAASICMGGNSASISAPAEEAQLERSAIEASALNRNNGLSAVDKLKNQRLLIHIATEAQDLYIRKAAVEKLTDQTVLGRIAREDINAYVRQAAVKRLLDQSILSAVVSTDNDVYVRKAAAERLTSQIALFKVASEDKNFLVRKAAVENLTDQVALSKVAMKETFPSVGLAAVSKLNDQTLLARVALNASNSSLRKAAIGKLTDQKVLGRLAVSDKNIVIRKAAMEKLTEQTVLAKIARNDRDLGMRKAAIGKLTNQKVLMEIAANNSAAAMRLAAITNSHLNNDPFILQRSVEDISAEVRLAAVESLHTQLAIAKAAQTSYEAGLREIANKLLKDAALQEETSVVQGRIKEEVAVIEKLPMNAQKLADIALTAKIDVIGEAAARRLEDPRLLAEVAVSSRRRNILKIVFAKLTDKSVMKMLAKKAVDPSLRLAAQIRMGQTWENAFRKASARRASNRALGEVLGAITFFPKQEGVREGVVEACLSFIRRGDESRIPELGELLHTYGDTSLAEDYLNCGQPDLDREARLWASQHGYDISTGDGSHRATWGSSRN